MDTTTPQNLGGGGGGGGGGGKGGIANPDAHEERRVLMLNFIYKL